MPPPFGFSGGFRTKPEKATPEQQYLREKGALMAAEKYYTSEEFARLMADLRDGLITVRIFEDGIVIDRDGRSLLKPRRGR
jgi:hypothetical protein